MRDNYVGDRIRESASDSSARGFSHLSVVCFAKTSGTLLAAFGNKQIWERRTWRSHVLAHILDEDTFGSATLAYNAGRLAARFRERTEGTKLSVSSHRAWRCFVSSFPHRAMAT